MKNDLNTYIDFRNKLISLEETITPLTDLYEETVFSNSSSLKETLISYFDSFLDSDKKDQTVIKTGYHKFDAGTGGFEKGSLTVIGSTSSYYSLSLNLISKLLNNTPELRIGLISARKNDHELQNLFLSIHTSSTLTETSSFQMDNKTLKRVKETCEKDYNKPFFINANIYPSFDEFKSAVIRMYTDYKIDILFIDSFECVGHDVFSSFENEFEKNRSFSRFLKELAEFLEIPLIASIHCPSKELSGFGSEELFASSGISFHYVDNILFVELENYKTDNEYKRGTIYFLKGKKNSYHYSVSLNTSTARFENLG